MDTGSILRYFLCIIGVILLFFAVSSLARKKLTESFALIWGGLAVISFITGILIQPVLLNNYISLPGMVLIVLCVVCALWGAYFISLRVSELMRKNAELAIDVSLLHQETDEMNRKITELMKTVEKLRRDGV